MDGIEMDVSFVTINRQLRSIKIVVFIHFSLRLNFSMTMIAFMLLPILLIAIPDLFIFYLSYLRMRQIDR